MTNLDALSQEFPKDQVSWRVQGKPYERNRATPFSTVGRLPFQTDEK